MTDQPDGMAIARARIAAEAEARTGFLDLIGLGLPELPEELLALKHLQRLYLGPAPGSVDEISEDRDPPANRGATQLGRLTDLPQLAMLSISRTDCADLRPLAGLTELQSLHCDNTQVSDLSPLAGLTELRTLNCWNTQVSDLSPLARLTELKNLNCSVTQVCDLSPLTGLTELKGLNCSHTQVSDLSPLAGLTELRTLNCWHTQVSDLSPLAGLTELKDLNCDQTQVSDLSPLAGLIALQRLDCWRTQVSDLSPLSGLPALQSLDCSYTPVSDLSPLSGLPALQRLDCSHCNFRALDEPVWFGGSLREVTLYGARLPGVPAAVLSQYGGDNCLPRLRAHLTDLRAGREPATDVKLLVLGNGKAGKTQLCNRLRGADFQDEWDSTHGISVTDAPLAMPDGAPAVRLNLWDFGGQDIYHGTHALFVRSNAVFLLAWAKDTENAETYEHDGIAFRNYPLAYWTDYVRHLAQGESPTLIVQGKCDTRADEAPRAPVPAEALDGVKFCGEVRYSARNGRGRDLLDASLRHAVAELQDSQGSQFIPKGWLAVQRRIEALRGPDGTLPEDRRLLDRGTFEAWCADAGGVTAPEHLLAYLHNAGILFYEAGLFDDRIVLDHAWALNAIYAVFDRTNSYTALIAARGRFQRPMLEALVWQGYSTAEQRHFLGLMRNCGICFVHSGKRYGDDDDDTVYVAPDLLPPRDAVADELEARWPREVPTERTTVYDYPLLHDGLMRAVISRIGARAGVNALYWRGGVCAYERSTGSRVLIEQSVAEDAWAGTVTLTTKGGRSAELAQTLRNWIEAENQRLGLSPEVSGDTTDAPRHPLSDMRDEEGEDETAVQFAQEPYRYCVSYAWGDDDSEEGREREALVNRICEEAAARGERVLRDKQDMALGDSITEFMDRLAGGQRIFVFLSDKYLRSPYCTYELYRIWENCRGKGDEFTRCVRVFVLPGLGLSFDDRVIWHEYWVDKFEKMQASVQRLTERGRLGDLPPRDFERYRAMEKFNTAILDILGTVEDRLRPADWDAFVEHGFDDPPDV